jgi:hypothetical protein
MLTRALPRRALGVAVGAILAFAVAGSALADSCANISRAPAPCGSDCTAPVIVGNWVWLPSVGEQTWGWGFAPPGAFFSTTIGFPGANGNYQNGYSSSLLGHSAYCLKGVNQTKSHGIISGCE